MIDREELEREIQGLIHESEMLPGMFNIGVSFGLGLALDKIRKAKERAGGF